MKDLKELRQQIDEIDVKLLQLVRRRMNVAAEIAEYKAERNQRVSDPVREHQKIRDLCALAAANGVAASCAADLFRTLIRHTVSYEQRWIMEKAGSGSLVRDISVSYLGTVGTYSHLAAHRYLDCYGGRMTERSCSSFDEVVALVEDGSCEYGMLPVENSSSGSINEVLDVLQVSGCHIVGELFFPVDHALLALSGAELKGITDIYSHPQPVQQCSAWLKSVLPGAVIHYVSSSSEALDTVRSMHQESCAVLASRQAADYYGLRPLVDNIANNPHNYTRFICVSRDPVTVPENISAKTSISFTVQKYKPGSLMAVLNEFSRNHINLIKLSSRPRLKSGRETWEEIFFADVQGNTASPVMQDILENLHEHTGELKVLGCYESAEQSGTLA